MHTALEGLGIIFVFFILAKLSALCLKNLDKKLTRRNDGEGKG